MDYKKTNAPTNTVTRNMMELCEDTGNVYETVAIIGKRANQIAVEMKNDPHFWHLKQSGRIRRVVSRPVCPNRFSIFCTCSGSFTLNS